MSFQGPQFSSSFQVPQFSLTPIQKASSVNPPPAQIVNLSDSDSMEECAIPKSPVAGHFSTPTSTSSGFFQIPPSPPAVDVSRRASTLSGFFGNTDCSAQVDVSARASRLSGFSVFPQRTQGIDVLSMASGSSGLTVGDDVSRDFVCEVQVQSGQWHVRRMSTRGVGPKCCGSLGRKEKRDECRNFVKRVSLPNPLGLVGIAVFAPKSHHIFGSMIFRMTWFSPNNTCFRGRVRRSIVLLSPFPEDFVVKSGTSLSVEEILNFLIQNGVKQMGVKNVPVFSTPGRAAIDRCVNVEIFPEKISSLNVSFRFSTRNGRPVRLRSMLSAQHLKKIRSSEAGGTDAESVLSVGINWKWIRSADISGFS